VSQQLLKVFFPILLHKTPEMKQAKQTLTFLASSFSIKNCFMLHKIKENLPVTQCNTNVAVCGRLWHFVLQAVLTYLA
jgi:hypothetical protein